MRQMMLREALEEAGDAADPEAELDELSADVSAELRSQREQFEKQYNTADYEQAAGTVRKMQFLEKLVLEIEAREDELLD